MSNQHPPPPVEWSNVGCTLPVHELRRLLDVLKQIDRVKQALEENKDGSQTDA